MHRLSPAQRASASIGRRAHNTGIPQGRTFRTLHTTDVRGSPLAFPLGIWTALSEHSLASPQAFPRYIFPASNRNSAGASPRQTRPATHRRPQAIATSHPPPHPSELTVSAIGLAPTIDRRRNRPLPPPPPGSAVAAAPPPAGVLTRKLVLHATRLFDELAIASRRSASVPPSKDASESAVSHVSIDPRRACSPCWEFIKKASPLCTTS